MTADEPIVLKNNNDRGWGKVLQRSRISDEIVRQLLNDKRVVCSGKFTPMGEKVPFELDSAIFSSRKVKQGYRELFINDVSIDDMIRNRRNQWYLDRKQREALERAQRTSRGRRM